MKQEKGYIFLYTVKDLKEYLEGISDDVLLESNDTDCDGYDVCENSFINPSCTINSMNEVTHLALGHLEFEIYKYNKKIYKEYFC